jgi:dipeptidase D
MKKAISIILIIALMLASAVAMAGCGESFDEEAANKLEKDVYDLYEQFKPVFAEAGSEYDITAYLYDWAQDNGLVARKLGGGNVVLTKPASVPDRTLPTTIVQCAVSIEDAKDASQRAAIALASVMNLKENGKAAVLFTVNKDGSFNGAKRLSLEDIDSDYFIHLESGESTAVNNGSAGTAEYEMSVGYSLETPTATTAYRLSVSGLPGDESSVLTGSHPNGILIISNFLIGCRASGMLVELADFDGGSSAGTYPASANAVVMVNQNSEAKLLSRFESNHQKFVDKYSEDFPDATYTLTKIDAPKKVIRNDDAANILSLLYTTINGVFKTSEENGGGTTLAVANIGKLTIKANKMSMRIMARSVDQDVLVEMADSYHATAFLSDATFRIVDKSIVWPSDLSRTFAGDFIKAAEDAGLDGLSQKPTFVQSECAVFYEKEKDINMISFSVNNNDAFLDAKALLFYITGLARNPS